MKEKHIQGPWSVEGMDNAGQFHVCAGGNLIAVTAHEGVMPDDIQRANADLIAAAPDLLVALEKVEFYLKPFVSRGYPEQDTLALYKSVVKAMAKAEGKE